ncbi:hypothetical protein LTR70_001560 [Exophiala xenobiotica]|uniref:BSD domain-containing protein n=1 Tax=Lithohypha guttulata TaxID=1690604 RepID=A0ABR0KD88_9EURO|nr:hypothetical protein LTR24_003995 [Lithohypha guttulata]KAK5327937.1 hypothetical protein LTR70_001560 [Exophiala xenobiotica]
MDFAYDHIAERSYSNDPDRSSTTTPKPADAEPPTSTTPTQSQSQATSSTSDLPRANLQTEFQETFRAFSASPWGAKLGGWWSTAQKQGASYYEVARREAEKREAEAARVLEDARNVVAERAMGVVEGVEERLDEIVNEERRGKEKEQKEAGADADADADADAGGRREGEDTETFLNRFKSEAAKRLKEVQKAEDAADEALLRFGSNIRHFLKDTISVSAPSEGSDPKSSSEVLFESKDARTGKRVIHASRFDAQLHVIHTTSSSFTHDPDSNSDPDPEGASSEAQGEWDKFKRAFDIEAQTDRIARDLEKYPDLRAAMESLVPESVEYKDFWTRYYFLRHVVQVREERRREMLRASADQPEEEVAWDEDSDSDSDPEAEGDHDRAPAQKETVAVAIDPSEISATPATPAQSQPQPQPQPAPGSTMATSHTRTDSDAMTLRPSRRSHDEKSVADSEASYDLVSGAASHANSSPKGKPGKEEESDDDDWE